MLLIFWILILKFDEIKSATATEEPSFKVLTYVINSIFGSHMLLFAIMI